MNKNQMRVIEKMKELHECVLSYGKKKEIYVESINKSKGISLYYLVKANGSAKLIDVKKFMGRKV
jgi:hypothetical protein